MRTFDEDVDLIKRREAFFRSLAPQPEPEEYVLSMRQKVEAVTFGAAIWIIAAIALKAILQ